MAERGEGSLEALRIDRSRQPVRRRRRRWLVLALALLLMAVMVVVLVLRRAPAVEVAQVREARPGEQATVLSAAGYVASRRRSVIAPKVAGRLEAVRVEEGQAVQEGELLAELDSADAQVALRQAQAEAAAARSRLEATRASLVRARRDARRTRPLLEAGAITRAEHQDAQSAYQAAQADARAAAAQLTVSRRAVQRARLQLGYTRVLAPFSGTVLRKLADEGAVLAPAALTQENVGGIVELVDLNALEVEAEVSEDQLRRIRPGQPALIFLDAFPDRVYRAVTGTVRPGVDRSKGTATVKVLFRERPAGVLPDMAAKVSFLSEDLPAPALREARLRVPAVAVVVRDGRRVVLVVEEDARVSAKPVKLGERVGNEVVVLEGPPSGTQVVTTPGSLRAGRRVRVKAPGR